MKVNDELLGDGWFRLQSHVVFNKHLSEKPLNAFRAPSFLQKRFLTLSRIVSQLKLGRLVETVSSVSC